MLITNIKLKNWRNFKEADVPMGGRVFVIGPNASGKSNFLEAFRFLRDIAKEGGGLQQAVTDRGGLSKIRCLAARRDPEVALEVQLADSVDAAAKWTYAIAMKQETSGHRRTILTRETVHRGDDLVLSRPNDEDEEDPRRLTQTHLEQINSNQAFREIGDVLRSIRYMHLVPQFLKHPELFVSKAKAEDPFGLSFLEMVASTPAKTRSAWLRKIQEALQVAVPHFRELEFKREETTGKPHLEALYEHWRPKAGKQREDQFSDGTLRLIGLLWCLLDGTAPLLLEEPELSLNREIVRRLPELIARMVRDRKRQVIITTHSADLLANPGIAGEETVLMSPGKEGTRVELTASIPEIRTLLESGLPVGEAASSYASPSTTGQLDLFAQ